MPPDAPVTSASRSRHRSMPALVMVPSRLPTSLGEPGTGIAELRRLELLKLGGSLVTAGGGAGNLEMLELRLDPPPGGPASGRGSALGTSALGHMASEWPPFPDTPTPAREPVAPAAGGNRTALRVGAHRGSGAWTVGRVAFTVNASRYGGEPPAARKRTHALKASFAQSPLLPEA